MPSWLHFVLSIPVTEPVPNTLLHTHFFLVFLLAELCSAETWPPQQTTATELQCVGQAVVFWCERKACTASLTKYRKALPGLFPSLNVDGCSMGSDSDGIFTNNG